MTEAVTNIPVSYTHLDVYKRQILGLQGQFPTASRLIVKTAVLQPSLAAASPASIPACPAPTTATSKFPASYSIEIFLRFPFSADYSQSYSNSSSSFSNAEFFKHLIDNFIRYPLPNQTGKRRNCVLHTNCHRIIGEPQFQCLQCLFYRFQRPVGILPLPLCREYAICRVCLLYTSRCV